MEEIGRKERKFVLKILELRKTSGKTHIHKLRRNQGVYEKWENIVTEEKVHLLQTCPK